MSTADADRVAGALCRLVAEHYGPSARLEDETAVRRRPWSVHLHARVRLPGRRVDLIVKIPLWDEAPGLEAALAAGPQADTRAEFEALAAIAAMVESSGDPGLAAIRPVAYLEDLNAVVTERLAARPLGSLRHAERLAAAPALGRWLRRYHDEIGGAAEAPFDPAPQAARLRAATAGLPPGPIHEAAGGVEWAAAGLAGAAVRVAVTHGDLGPSNVLVTPSGKVAVLDPNRVPGPVAGDLVKPAVALRTRRWRLLAGWRAGRPDRFAAALASGYGPVDLRALAVVRGVAVVERWAEVERSAGGGWRRAALIPARRVLRGEAG